MRYAYLILALALSTALTAQTRLNTELRLSLQQLSPAEAAESRTVLVKGDLATLDALLPQYEGRMRYSYGNIASVSLPAGHIEALVREQAVQRVEWHPTRGHVLADTMRVRTGADLVQAGAAPLPQAYDGSGILAATIDLGMEWRHPDFRTADDRTRILHLWDQNYDTLSNTLYGHGYTWDSAAINADALLGAHDPDKYSAHGSHATGLMAGNGMAADTFVGMAPGSDILHVDISFGDFTNNFLDAMDYLLTRAEELGQPIAINSSVGGYAGAHDGRDLASQLIENMLSAAPGRVLTQAAGNAGNANYHIELPGTTDTLFTWYTSHNYGGQRISFINLYADSADVADLYFSVANVKTNTWLIRDRTPYLNLTQDFETLSDGTLYLQDSLFAPNGNLIGVIDIFGDYYEGAYDLYINCYAFGNSDRWEVAVTGTGMLDGYNDRDLIGNANFFGSIPDSAEYPRIQYHVAPDRYQSIVGSWNCSPAVISVGMHDDRNSYVDYNGNLVILEGDTPGDLSPRSSRGPTRTGIIKPDVSAPGQRALSPTSLAIAADLIANDPANISFTGFHTRFSGTSSAAPMVGGAAALYLQLRPEATHLDIRDALHAAARVDSFVLGSELAFGAAPNPDWGYGKLDIFTAMVDQLVYGCTDTAALNYDPLADVNLSDSCEYATSSVSILPEPTIWSLAPNPAHGRATVQWHLDTSTATRLVWYDIQGRMIAQQALTGSVGATDIDLGSLSPGVYVGVLELADGRRVTRKMMVR